MIVDWRRKLSARPWLLLRPGNVDQPWDWLLVQGNQPSRHGKGQPPTDLEARVALIIPAASCSHFHMSAPPGLKRDEWPLLLEDRLLQAADDVLCACLGRSPGQLRLAVVARAQLQVWREQCAGWALNIERCWTEMQLLPAPAVGSGWRWQRGNGLELLRATTADGLEHWLCWPQRLGQEPSRPWAELQLNSVQGSWPTQLQCLDSLPDLFAAPRQRQPLKLPRGPLRLAVGCLAMATLWAGIWVSQQWRQAEVYRQQVLAVTGEQATLHQASVALKRLGEVHSERQLRLRKLQDLQAQLDLWLGKNSGWRLQAVRFDGQRWQLRLDGEGRAPDWQALAKSVGASVEVGAAGQWPVVFDLGAA
ncbi:GspL/Epsl periplasmic domain-containing protein [Pseudomonas shirazensis]|uniref:GspL/Epsl periplasmic domain-containing protein n=1 Tax=Pseudomonas shirazensis TaxID=2745494 RepID=UPI003986DCB2